ncbi:T9SS type A sorting domain-containing protein [Winogradskyella haliclonae]|uniref:Secretion system C-terminal sorting domain-containing protein n=1 Tax=Winogradskyella haliclonae TaxID=2048558 RepID=A0ABQ2BYN8_9FLAO|nr:T9SS type A sorting domain-containing protein [Winogradskyella haliclonae]GGI56628.1 hypothetical protein GCM10011444_09370 [Winogradskyella haliclonae]
MKKITLAIFLLCFMFGFTQTQTDILDLPFTSDPPALDNWRIIDTGFTSEQSLTFDSTNGNPAGSLSCVGVVNNPGDMGPGRSFQYLYEDNMFNFGNASTLSISFDIRIDVALSNTNLQFQTQVSRNGGGVVVVNNENIQNAAMLGQWTRLTYNMTPTPADFDNNGNLLIFFFNMATAPIDGSGGSILVDNVVITATENAPTCDDGIQNGNETGVDCGGPDCAACIEAPTTGAPEPTIAQSEVLSVYSGAYTSGVTNLNLYDFGSNPAVFSEVDLDGNSAVRIENYGFYGARWDAVDVSSYDFVHLDYYAQTASSFQFFALDASLGTTICCGNAEEPRYFVGGGGANEDEPLVQGQWIGVDIPLTAFSNYAALINGTWDGTDIVQWKLEGQGILYFDNVYFYNQVGPANDTCGTATSIPLDGTSFSISNIGATDSGEGGVSCGTGVVSDVWYSFDATITEEAYFQTNAPNLSVYSGSCGALTQIACNPGTSAVTGLVNGTTYYVRVNDDGTTRVPGNFTVAANESSFSTNNFDINSIRVYPNPTNDGWNIEGANSTIDTIEVYDILGKRVQTLNPNSQQTTIDASGLKTGLYLAKFYSGDAVKTIKLVKN